MNDRNILPMILSAFHVPVLKNTVTQILRVKPGGNYIDATAGGGGYVEEIRKREGRVIAIDADQNAIGYLQKRFTKDRNIFIRHGNFKNIGQIVKQIGWKEIHGILFDLGMSSHQIDDNSRGFSFRSEAQLDMRMDSSSGMTAADILNNFTQGELYEIFIANAEELHSRSIAQAIVRSRTLKKFRYVSDVVKVIDEVLLSMSARKNGAQTNNRSNLSTYARIFQALRITVNSELVNLKTTLIQSIDLLTSGSVVIVLSYHSLEDRIVKTLFSKYAQLNILHYKRNEFITPSYTEIIQNKRAKSAKMRYAIKI